MYSDVIIPLIFAFYLLATSRKNMTYIVFNPFIVNVLFKSLAAFSQIVPLFFRAG